MAYESFQERDARESQSRHDAHMEKIYGEPLRKRLEKQRLNQVILGASTQAPQRGTNDEPVSPATAASWAITAAALAAAWMFFTNGTWTQVAVAAVGGAIAGAVAFPIVRVLVAVAKVVLRIAFVVAGVALALFVGYSLLVK